MSMLVAMSILLGQVEAGSAPLPIIDMHLHSASASSNGPPGSKICVPFEEMPTWDPNEPWAMSFTKFLNDSPCDDPIVGPMTDEEVMIQTLAIMERRNIIGVASGPTPLLQRWQKASPDRIIPALHFGGPRGMQPKPELVRQWFEEKRYAVFAEVTIQYYGGSPSDDFFDAYLTVVEDLDIPMGIHIGPGPPGQPYLSGGDYRARLHSALVLEEALIRHPKLRVYIMHAGWPMIDDLIAVMYAHPQVHVDVGVISWAIPRKEFHRYLQRIVEAGFGKRVMFGSDQMNWPGTIEVAIEGIETAEFLSREQKRDIFYHNAARFLRLNEAEIASHHGI